MRCMLRQTAKNFHMLLLKEDNVNARKQGIGFENHNDVDNPFILNKAKVLTPSLYNNDKMGKDLLFDHKIVSEEELKWNIDGKTLGKDGKPLKAFRNVHFEPDVYTRSIPLNDAPVCNTTNITSDIEAHQDVGKYSKISSLANAHDEPDVSVKESVEPKSFASIINNTPTKKVVKLAPLTNNEEVQGAHVTLPLDAAKEVSSRFINTLYGYFIGKRLAFPIVENYVKNAWAKYGIERVMLQNGFFFFQFSSRDGMEKVLENGPWLIRLVPIILNVWTPTSKLKRDEITTVPVWVKLHNVPIVACSEIGLSLLTTTLGKPIMLDGYTSNMDVNSWGINSYARALIEVSAEKELMESIVMAIPIDNGLEHSLETIEVEYEWQPPRCATCKIFDHQDDKCPKKPKVVITTQQSEDGFVEVTRKKTSGKQNSKPRQIEGIRLTKPKPNYQFRPINNQASKSDGTSTSQPDDAAKEEHIPKNKTDSDLIPKCDLFEVDSNHMPLNNSFASLMDEDTTTGTQNKPNANHSIDSDQSGYDSDSEEVENIILEQPRFMGNRTKSDEAKGASTPSNEVLNNPNDVDILVITQNDQVMHTRIWFKVDKKELFCSFVYAHNRYIHRRALWSNLCLHKHYVRDRSWCLLGDFNAALNLVDHSSRSSNIDISMREFRDCVEEIEVLYVNRAGLNYT
ncbi:zinc knuckle CX2CX4HX4C containing protein [Tanacetum coccineum]